jgi:hypothetical protein
LTLSFHIPCDGRPKLPIEFEINVATGEKLRGFGGPQTHYSRAQSTIRREYRRLYALVSISIAG